MSSFGPAPTWATPRPSLRLLPALLLAALALAFALTPMASAQEVDPGGTGEPAGATEPPIDSAPVPESPPIPEPPRPPDPAPSPEPAASAPEPPPAPEPAASPVDPPQQPAERDAVAHAGPSSFEPAATTFTPAAQAPAVPIESSDPAGPTTAPLGWDVYDDVLLAETFKDDGGAGTFGAGAPAVFRGLRALGTIASPVERDRRHDANPPSRAEPMSAGGSGPGGSGPGQGPSLGLFGAAGGSGAGMALLTLLGMACGWLLLAPLPKRAFLTSTAMWRPSAYVPPIDRPG
jgi:hypothetical protein